MKKILNPRNKDECEAIMALCAWGMRHSQKELLFIRLAGKDKRKVCRIKSN